MCSKNAPRKAGVCSEESWSLLGGKWRFPRRKVGLCSEESQMGLKGAKMGVVRNQSCDNRKFPTNSYILQRNTGLNDLLEHVIPLIRAPLFY